MADTIVALSSGAPPSGVAILRLAGPATRAALAALSIRPPEPRRLTLSPILAEGELIDTGLVAWFPAPHSFTGEDCAELQVHGSPAVIRRLLRFLVSLPGVRLAEAGEFTRRAFENGRLDLTEVEGLGDLIVAETETQRQQAVARLAGGVSTKIDSWRHRLLDLRAEIEAQLDFSDEGDVGDLPPSFAVTLMQLDDEFAQALQDVAHGRIVREGLRIALAGPPNAGKSSLLNALAKADVAIVTDEAGTTRDVREVPLDLGGYLVTLIDMAGLRETDSKAEAEGVRRAHEEIAGADLLLWLAAPDIPNGEPPPTSAPIWKVATKSDLLPGPHDLAISAKTGAGIATLLQRLHDFARSAAGGGEPALLSRERDRLAIEAARLHLSEAATRLSQPELAAESLRRAGQSLERLLGRMDAEAVLDQLFLRFCIGK